MTPHDLKQYGREPAPMPRTQSAKIERAKELLGARWLLHPSNQVQRKTPFTWRSNYAA